MDSQNEHPTLHRDELPIAADVVAALIRRDVPEFSSLPLAAVDSAGSTNTMFRLGDTLSVRLPRQAGGGEDIVKEARLTPMLSAALPVSVPEVIAVGGPGFGFPESWSVARWLPGEHPRRVTSVETSGIDREALAEGLAAVVSAFRHLEVPEHVGGELRWYRGGALSDFDPEVRRALDLCRDLEGLDLDLDRAEAVWKESLALPDAHEPGPDRWFHGDLVAENLLVSGGKLSAALDFGAVSVGDPTIDLHGSWEVLDAPAREVFARRLGVDEAEWLRGRAWALGVALTAISDYWTTMPGRRDDRLPMAHNVLDD